MSTTTTSTVPAVGDEFSYSVLVSEASFWHQRGNESGHKKLGPVWTAPAGSPDRKLRGWARECDPHAERTCTLCFDQWETRTSRVVSVDYYMDNSVEVTLEDGARRTVIAPHGDACF